MVKGIRAHWWVLGFGVILATTLIVGLYREGYWA